jgi:hypothetical protein
VRYTSVQVPELLTDQGALVLELEAVAERDVEEVVYGFMISDSSGNHILGTNSMLKRQPCGGLTQGEHVQVRWSVPNVFSDGLHHVELAITDRQGLTIYDSWKEAATFTVVKEEKTPYLVTPDTSFSFARSYG